MRANRKRLDARHQYSAPPLHYHALQAAAEIQRNFISDRNATRQFTEALETLLSLTESEYGFAAELQHDADGTPWLKNHAITEVNWVDKHRKLYDDFVRDGLAFRRLDNLLGEVIRTGETVIANSAPTDPRFEGVPDGHPPLSSFLGIPLRFGDELVGMAGLANRDSDYIEELVSQLEPLTTACASMLIAVRAERRQKRTEDSLRNSLERQQAILKAVPDLIFLMSREGQFLEAWTTAEPELLIPPDNLIGRTHREALPATVCDLWDEAVIETEATGKVISFEYRLEVRGKTRWYEARITCCCSDKQAVLTVVRDITDRWDAEEAESRQFQLLRAIAENTQELIFVKDTERKLLFVNAAAEAVLGHDHSVLIGTTADEVLPAEASAAIEEADQRVLQSGQPVTYEETLPGVHGNRAYVTSKTPWRSRTGEILGLVGIAQDITELQQTHEELRRSQRFVESIAEASPHITYVFDVTTQRNLYSNRRITEDLGFSPAEIQEMGDDFLRRLLHPDDQNRLPELLKRWETAQDGDVLETEYRMQSASGEWRWFLGRDTVFRRDTDGRVREIIGTAQDITERVVAQQALTESEARLRAIIESEPECVKLVAPDGTLVEMNAAGVKISEAESADVIIGRSVFDLVAPEDQARFKALHRQVCDGMPGTLEFDIVGMKGTRKRMETHAVPLTYGPNGEVGHLAVTRNITETRAAEELIAQQQAQLLHVSRLSTLGQMAAAISHEITQPLSAITNFAAACRLLLKRPEPNLESIAGHIETIDEQAHRAGDTLDRIRTFIGGADTPKNLRRIDEVISGALSLMKAELRNQQTTVVLSSAEQLPPVSIDHVQIQQVITNLVTNACDAMQETAPEERRIVIECSKAEDAISVTVVDNGPGLNGTPCEKLFEAFQTSKSEGMGLGLAICRDIVVAHGGDIRASNATDRGAMFRFTLPVAEEHGQ